MESLGKGLYEQMQDSKTNSKSYNNLTLDKLTEFATQIADGLNSKSAIIYPELSEKQMEDYVRIIKKVKDGYLYQIKGSDESVLDKRRLILTTGSEGCKGFIKSCMKDNIPPSMVIPDIWVIDDERNIMVKLMDVKWIRK